MYNPDMTEGEANKPLIPPDVLLQIKTGVATGIVAVALDSLTGFAPNPTLLLLIGSMGAIAGSPAIRDFNQKYRIVAHLKHFYQNTVGQKIALLQKARDARTGEVYYESYASPDASVEVTHMLEAGVQEIEVAEEDVELDEADPDVQRLRTYINGLTTNMKHSYARSKDKSRSLAIAPNFNPDIDDLLGVSLITVGIKGSGKTYMNAVVIEAIAPFNIPMVIFDKEGDFVSLLPELKMNGMIAGHSSSAIDHPDGSFVEINEENATQFGYNVLQKGYQVIFDLRGYPSDEAAAKIMIDVVAGLSNWTNARENRGSRVPMLLFLDEAQHWLPQDKKMSRLQPQTLANLMFSFVDVAQKGRKRGLIPMYACQRISDLDKAAMAQVDMYMFGRARLDNDLKRYMEYITPLALGFDDFNTRFPIQEAKKVLSALGQGDFITCMPDGQQFVIHTNKRRSVHVSNTPKLANAQARYGNTGTIAPSYEATTQVLAPANQTQVLSPSTTRLLSMREVWAHSGKVKESEFAEIVLAYAGKIPDEEYLRMLLEMPDVEAKVLRDQGGEIPAVAIPMLTPEARAVQTLSEREQMVLTSYTKGFRGNRDIAADTGINRTYVGNFLRALRTKGFINDAEELEDE